MSFCTHHKEPWHILGSWRCSYMPMTTIANKCCCGLVHIGLEVLEKHMDGKADGHLSYKLETEIFRSKEGEVEIRD